MVKIRRQNIEPGDVLSRPKGLCTHRAVYLGEEMVLQNTPGRGEHKSSMAEFAKGKRVNVFRIPEWARASVLRNARKVLRAPRTYSLLTNNCEHTVTRVLVGKGFSDQLRIFSTAAIAATILVIALRQGRR